MMRTSSQVALWLGAGGGNNTAGAAFPVDRTGHGFTLYAFSSNAIAPAMRRGAGEIFFARVCRPFDTSEGTASRMGLERLADAEALV